MAERMSIQMRGDALSPRVGVALGLVVLGWLCADLMGAARPSADLLPLWLAGEAFAEGAFDRIYAPVEAVYRMVPPEGWIERARANGHEGFVFPFVYPPLWAWVFGKLHQITDFQGLVAAASALNLALLAGICVLARRASGVAMAAVPYTVIGLVLLLGTVIGKIALHQNQAQILVAFLVVLALERSRAGRPVTAGAALAIAASIKLFPALFAVLWLASGERRAFAAFAAVGAGLGLASVAVAGWPLHREFLAHVSAIGHTGFFSPLSFSLDGLVAGGLSGPRIEVALGHTAPGVEAVIAVVQKPEALVLAGKAVLGLLLAGFALAMARAGRATRHGALWPAALVLFPLIGPLAWGYYFIAATAFAPVLVARFGPWAGTAVLAAIFVPLQEDVLRLIGRLPGAVDYQQLGVAVMLLLAGAFLVSARRMGVLR